MTCSHCGLEIKEKNLIKVEDFSEFNEDSTILSGGVGDNSTPASNGGVGKSNTATLGGDLDNKNTHMFSGGVGDNSTPASNGGGDNKNITKYFCCEGCKLVYTILKEQGLLNFYNIITEKNAGVSLKNVDTKDYSVLDLDEYSKLYTIKTSTTYKKIAFILPNIHCAACVWLLEKLPKLNQNILSARLNYLHKEIIITYSPTIDPINIKLSEIAELLASIGYPPDLQSNAKKNIGKEAKKYEPYLLRMGVSGFAFGNAMLFSFPEYLDKSLTQNFTQVFSLLNFTLSLPVLFYCAFPYFQNCFMWLSSLFKSIKSTNQFFAKLFTFNLDLPIVLGILCMYGRSLYELYINQTSGYFDSFMGLIFFLSVGRFVLNKSFDHIRFDRKYTTFFPLSVKSNNKFIPVKDLIQGDRITLRYLEINPTDIILISPDFAKVDQSYITGEEKEITYKKGELIPAGAKIISPSIEAVVSEKMQNSSLSKIWEISETNFNKNKFQLSIQKIAPYFTTTVLIIAMSAFYYWLPNLNKALTALTSIFIITCPCALSMVTPFVLGNALNVLGKLGFYVKNIEVIEKFYYIKHIIFDKTGTLTSRDNYHVKFISFLQNVGTPTSINTPTPPLENVADFTNVGTPTDSHLPCSQIFNISTHPHSVAISNFINEYQKIDSESLIENYKNFVGEGYTLTYKSENYVVGSLNFIKKIITLRENEVFNKFINQTFNLEEDKNIKKNFNLENENNYNSNLNNLKNNFLNSSFVFYAKIENTENAGNAENACITKNAGITENAGIIKYAVNTENAGITKNAENAENAGIIKYGNILGVFILDTSLRGGVDNMLTKISKHFKNIFLYLLSGDKKQNNNIYDNFFAQNNLLFEKDPIAKIEFIEKLSSSGDVLMIGDGLNDAGAFLKSNIGIALTENTTHFTPESSVIMQANLLSKFYNIFCFIKSTRYIIWFSLIISFLYNIAGLFLAVQAKLNPLATAIFMPISSISVIFICFTSIKLSFYFYLKRN